MKQIRIFKENTTQKSINSFLKKVNGVIVNYSPIIVEYELFDSLLLPTVTCKGLPNTSTFRANNDLYDEYMNPITVRYNSVLFFCNKIVLLNDLKEILTMHIELVNESELFLIHGTNGNIKLCIDYIDNDDFYIDGFFNYLESFKIYSTDDHINYNTRTKMFEVSNRKMADSNNNIANSNIIASKKIESGLISVSDMSRRIHNSVMNGKKIS